MPVIQFGGYTKDPFGGPAGGTQQALAGLLDAYTKTQEAQKKREQEQLLAELLGTNPSDNQVPGAEGISMNLPQDPMAANDPATAQMRMQAVMSNPNLPLRDKLAAGQMLKMQQDLMPDPLVEKDVPEIVRLQRYMDRLPEDSPQRAQLAARIEVLSSRKEQTDPEIIRLQNKLPDYPEGSPRHQEILNRIRVLSTEGSAGGGGGKTPEEREQELLDAGKTKIGKQWYPETVIDRAWKNSVRYIEPYSARWSGLSDEEKRANEQRLAEKPYDQFIEDSRRKGYLPGRGPLSEAATVPMPDETAKKGPAPTVRASKDAPKEADGLPSKEEVKALMVETGWKEGEPVTPAVKARARALYEKKKAKGK